MFGRKKAMDSTQISGINEDGHTCGCGAEYTGGNSWLENNPTGGPDLYVRELRCAQGHTATRKSDGG